MGKETIFMEEDIREFARQYRERYQPYKQYWNYEDGVVLAGYEALYRADGDSEAAGNPSALFLWEFLAQGDLSGAGVAGRPVYGAALPDRV